MKEEKEGDVTSSVFLFLGEACYRQEGEIGRGRDGGRV